MERAGSLRTLCFTCRLFVRFHCRHYCGIHPTFIDWSRIHTSKLRQEAAAAAAGAHDDLYGTPIEVEVEAPWRYNGCHCVLLGVSLTGLADI